MAEGLTNWSDAELYTDQEAFDDLPPLFTFTKGTDSKKYNLHDKQVKPRICEMIMDRFTDWPSFNIECITTDSIELLKEVAIQFNTALVSRRESKDLAEDGDSWASQWQDYEPEIKMRLRMIFKSLKFEEPEGINDRKFITRPVTR